MPQGPITSLRFRPEYRSIYMPSETLQFLISAPDSKKIFGLLKLKLFGDSLTK
jgi:hypothetical protein